MSVMPATEFLRAKPAGWLLAAMLLVPASQAAEQPVHSPKPEQAERAAPKPAPADRKELAAAFTKATPGAIADLKQIEQRVKTLVTRVSPAVVAVEVGYASGSGVVISADGLVLTAGHVGGRPGRDVRFTFPDGKTARGKTIGVARDSDTGLMRISDPGPWPHAAMGELEHARIGDWVLALGHPGGFDPRRSLVVRLGRIIRLAPEALQTDCTISPGDSGGPLFDMYGRVIGIHSAISRSVAENFHVSVTEFYDTWDQLVKGESGSSSEEQPNEQVALTQDSPALSRNRFRSGEETLRAFARVSAATRRSIVKFNVDGETVALGAVVGTNGLALTKASELKKGKLTCWLATEKEVGAEVLRVDEEEDVALVRVEAKGLEPLRWASSEVSIGQWAITPGIADTPHAVGIISALPRKIRPQRAFIGVQFDFSTSIPRIDELMPGLGAEKAGLKPGDLIIAVNSTAVTNRAQVIETLGDFRAGQTIKLRVQRAKEQFDAEVRLMPPSSGRSGRGFYPQRGLNRLGGEVSQRAEGFEQAIEHDTVLPPWLCGGPLVNLDGEAIGLNIARAGRVTTYALSSKLVKRILENLESMPQPTVENGK
ncbi:MAG TPA: trypsin-like peptidase domain-containing protein [Candidatus Binatia bacterium]|jgi:serine protease Do|nr:trypsin-like peptidase domain-containing protein [Candidatus Binatia bacterium]